ncbi:MAG: radical SAM protein [Bacteroidetes bacterium]|nr:radical SAM protein [Bacteroidota bacterium]
MNKVKYLIGFEKHLYNNYIKIYVFMYFFMQILMKNFPLKDFTRFLKRLLLFLSKMKLNKYVKSGRYTKVALYVPAFPSKAFFKACRKVMISESKMPCITVLISITSGCRYRCEHCYQKLDAGKDVDIKLLSSVTKKLDEMGVAFFNIEGGEPFLVFDRLVKICESISIGEIWVNSTGDGITKERLTQLKSLGLKGIMFSIHSSVPEKINSFMKREYAWENLLNGIKCCHKAGVEIAANTCILKDDYYNGNFRSILDLEKELGVSIVQLIKPKPSGGWLGKEMDEFTKEDLDYIRELADSYNNQSRYKDYPYVAAQIADENKDMFGCTAGGTDRFYINAKGDIQPCEFLNISFGNIRDEEFEIIYKRMRKNFEVPGDKWLCEECSNKIFEVVQRNSITALPLSKELSHQVIENWDRGSVPGFYEKVVKL